MKIDDYLADLAQFEPLLATREGRIELTKLDPLLFALVYMPHHLRDDSTGGEITLSAFHEDLIDYAREWIKPLRKMAEFRDAFIAPRSAGKSTWCFLLLPLWSAAHGHNHFTAAFADSGAQAQQHLSSFKHELETNQLLRNDFPDLCAPALRTNVARQLADNRQQLITRSGFIFMARGIDSSVLGMKVGAKRPDLIVLDDIEPGESQYSPYQKDQRLTTLLDVVFPLNTFARVLIVGTVVMAGSIIHDLLLTTREVDDATRQQIDWALKEAIDVHYYPALYADEDGVEHSLWPERWPVEELQAIRNTRSFAKNFQNEPVQMDGTFWTADDFLYDEADFYGPTLLSIDPAVTRSAVSDYTGIAVLSRDIDSRNRVYLRHAGHVKFSPEQLKAHVMQLLQKFPEIQLILIEVNQGGDLWQNLLADLPVPVKTVFHNESKPVRAQRALIHYQAGRVRHTGKFQVAETEMLAFPKSLNDDTLDAIVAGVLFFLKPKRKKGTRAVQTSYL